LAVLQNNMKEKRCLIIKFMSLLSHNAREKKTKNTREATNKVARMTALIHILAQLGSRWKKHKKGWGRKKSEGPLREKAGIKVRKGGKGAT